MNYTLPRYVAVVAVLVVLSSLSLGLASSVFAAPEPLAVLHGHLSPALRHHSVIKRLDGSSPVSMAIVLPLQNQAALNTLISRLSDPSDPLFGHYLTPAEFTEQFGPTAAQYSSVVAYLQSNGFTIARADPGRTLIDVTGTADDVSNAFGVHLNQLASNDGHLRYGPDTEPTLPISIAGNVAAIIGLDNLAVRHTHSSGMPVANASALASPNQIGTGPGGGLAPADFRTAYDINRVTATGTNQTLAVFELDGYATSDIDTYATHFGLPAPPLKNVLVDGVNGAAGANTAEVCLDLELQLAMAPGIKNLMCYEGPNSDQGVIDTYQRIASDDLASVISSSWGLAETESDPSTMAAEYQIFQEMAVDGQSIFAAAGDSGAYDDGFDLCVDDPASQPYVCGVGGTELYVKAGEAYNYETTWNDASGAGGGGISQQWGIPSYQSASLANAANMASTTQRNVPDVSFDASPYTGYAVVVGGSWWIYGGTSCAAPIWSGFTALVNQKRVAANLSELGFPNPPIYKLAGSSAYQSDFHDCAQGTNLYYPAVSGYDIATGWGSFDAYNLANSLMQTSTVPSAPTNVSAVANSGTGIAVSWTASTSATGYNIYRSTNSTSGFSMIGSSTVSPFIDTTAVETMYYYYYVTAANNLGESSPSSTVGPVAMPLPVPANVVATVSGTTAIVVSWSAVSGASSYKVYRSTGPTTGFSLLGGIAKSPFTDTSAVRGVAYFYGVTEITGNVESAMSVELSAVAIPLATPTGLSAIVNSSGGIGLNWNVVAAATSYKVYRSTSSTTGFTSIASTTSLSYTDSSITPTVGYYYEVSDITGGMESPPSAAVGPVTVPAMPVGVAVSLNAYDRISVSWYTVNGATGYYVYRSTNPTTGFAFTGSATSPPFTDLTAISGVAYYYEVTTTNSSGESKPSSIVGPITIPLAIPVGVVVTVGSAATINVSWYTVSGATSYKIYRSTNAFTGFADIGSSSASPYGDSAATPGVAYYYEVSEITGGIESPTSSAAGPVALPLTAPSGVTASPNGSGGVTVGWKAVTGAGSYHVYRSTSSTTGFALLGTSTSTSYTDSTATPGIAYYYEVSDITGTIESQVSAAVGPAVVPPPPTGVLAVATSNSITVSWSPVTGASSYSIYRSSSPTSGFTPVGSSSSSPYSDTSILLGVVYYYAVAETTSGTPSTMSTVAGPVTIPLTVPGGVSAALGTPTGIAVTWAPVAGANSYNIYRSTSAGSGFTLVGSSSVSPYTDNSAAGGVAYYYEVSEVTGGVESSKSSSTGPITIPLLVPSGVTAVPNGLGGVSVAWNTVAGAAFYKVYRSTNSLTGFALVGSSSSSPYTDSSATAGTPYYYAVSEVTGGVESLQSTSAGPSTVPVPPTGAASQVVGDTISVSWNAVGGASSYKVYRSTSVSSGFGLTGSSSASPYSDSTASFGVAYYYEITELTGGIESSKSTAAGPTTIPLVIPSGVSAALGVLTGITVTWSPVGGASSYNIYRSTSSASGFALNGSSLASPYTDNTAAGGVAYYYEVTEVSGGLESHASTAAGPVTIPLAVPGGVNAAPNGLGGVGISWNTVTGAASYKVYRSTSSTTGFVLTGSSPSSPFTDSSAAAGTPYYYEVSELTGGIESALSASAGPATVPVAPTGVTAQVLASAISVSWSNVGGASTYKVYRSTSAASGFALVGSSSSSPYSDTTAAPGVAYYYQVTELTGGVASTPSSTVGPFTVPLAVPTGVVAAPGVPSGIAVSWNAVSGASTYNVYRSTSPTSGFALNGSSSASPYTDTSAVGGVVYYYAVTEVTGGLESASSAVAGPVSLPLGVPGGVTAGHNSAGAITVAWNTVAGASSYRIYRSISPTTGFAAIASYSSSPYTDLSAVVGVAYYYKVSEVTGGIESSLSSAAGPVVGWPPIPSGVSAAPNVAYGITVSWSAVAGATSYNVYRSASPTSGFSITGSSTASPYSDANVVSGQTYYYYVTSVESSTESLPSAVTGPVTVYVPITGLVIQVGILTRNGGTNVVSVPITIVNQTGSLQQNLTVSASNYGGTGTSTSVPISLGNVVSGGSLNTTVTFAGATLYGGAPLLLTVSGSTTAGVFSYSGLVAAPYYSPEPKPVITSISPSSMPANSEQVLAITGSSFEYGATVKFGAYRLPTTFVTGNLIDVDIPAADNPALANYPGSVSIIVYNPAGTPSTSVMEGLTQPLPVITSISPSSVPAGRAFVLTINGYNFGQGSQVYLNGVGKSTTRLSSTQVSATILGSAIPTAGAANIQVQVPGAPGPSNTVQITVY